MKPFEKNEMDLLLRSLAHDERSPTIVEKLSEQPAGPALHLDADELNSYVEGVLPAATRSQYSAHLADCGRCRNLIIQLSSASGFAVRPSTVDEQGVSGFWQKVVAFF